MHDIPLILRYPFAKNLTKTLVAFAVFALFTSLFLLIITATPVSVVQKIFFSVGFLLSSVGAAFAFFASMDGLRNCLTKATVTVTNGIVTRRGQPPMALCAIKSMTLEGKPGKQTLLLTDGDGTVLPIRQTEINLPVETLMLALEQRKGSTP